MAPVTTGSLPKDLQPGLKAKFDGMYGSITSTWKQLYRDVPSDKKYEEIVSSYSTGLVDEKPEGGAISYDDISQGLTIRHTHKSYGKGIIITKEAMDDNLYGSLSKRGVEALVKSHKTNEEYVHADIFNQGFTVLQNHQEGGDGQYLFDTDHTSKNGTYSNLLTAATFSRAALQDGITQIRLTKDETGVHFSGLTAVKLVVPAALEWRAAEILKTNLQPDSANNNINPVQGIMSYTSWEFLDDASSVAWFIKTNADYGLIHYTREKANIRFSSDDDTYNEKIQSYSRYRAGVADNRGIFGNAGI